MAVNFYDTPAQANFVETYVPIKFDQLYKMSEAADKRIEKGQELIGDLEGMRSLGSISDVDNAVWDQYIYKPIADYINNNVRNSYDLNNPEVLSKLSSLKRAAANNPIASGLITSKKNLEGAANKVAPEFSNIYSDIYRNHNTLQSGSYVETPMQYEDWEKASKPFFDDVGSRYLGNNGHYRVYGVSPEDIQTVATAKANDIISKPGLRMLAEMDRRNGVIPGAYYSRDESGNPVLTQAGLDKYIFDKALSSGMDKTVKREEKTDTAMINEYNQKQTWARAYMAQNRADARAKKVIDSQMFNYTQQTRNDAINNAVNNAVLMTQSAVQSEMNTKGLTPEQAKEELVRKRNAGEPGSSYLTDQAIDYAYGYALSMKANGVMNSNSATDEQREKAAKDYNAGQSLMKANEADFAAASIGLADHAYLSNDSNFAFTRDKSSQIYSMAGGREFLEAYSKSEYGDPVKIPTNELGSINAFRARGSGLMITSIGGGKTHKIDVDKDIEAKAKDEAHAAAGKTAMDAIRNALSSGALDNRLLLSPTGGVRYNPTVGGAAIKSDQTLFISREDFNRNVANTTPAPGGKKSKGEMISSFDVLKGVYGSVTTPGDKTEYLTIPVQSDMSFRSEVIDTRANQNIANSNKWSIGSTNPGVVFESGYQEQAPAINYYE